MCVGGWGIEKQEEGAGVPQVIQRLGSELTPQDLLCVSCLAVEAVGGKTDRG